MFLPTSLLPATTLRLQLNLGLLPPALCDRSGVLSLLLDEQDENSEREARENLDLRLVVSPVLGCGTLELRPKSVFRVRLRP